MSDEKYVKAADDSVQRMIDAAMEAQARFKKAPHLVVADRGNDPMMELRKIYCPDSLGKNPSKHCYFGLWTDTEKLSNQGYAIVLNESRQPVRLNELVMMWKPIEFHKAQVQASQKQATDLMKGMRHNIKNDGKSTLGSDGGIPKPDRSGVNVEEIETGRVG